MVFCFFSGKRAGKEEIGMFGGLFEEEESSFGTDIQTGTQRKGIPSPSSPRSGVKLCGLSNLGATCYMNALLQTMTYTPELREALFSLTEDELGLGSGSGHQIRAIPVQLQNLFARILLLNQSSVGVEGLIDSFGWKNNEELQQHDVQELNRILFDAIESSLIGTSGHHVVRKLFHGTTVQQIICSKCGQVSEREEDFLDIAVPLSGRPNLEGALKEAFCDTERLEGPNQYRCEKCQGLVDAERQCRFRSLPPVLTFALLRFLYDYNKGERYKDTSRFQFPLTIDMSPYSTTTTPPPSIDPDSPPSTDDLVYDLYSLVIHSGSTHSGHYTVYIRDIDGLGTWTHPDVEPVSVVGNKLNEESTDPLEYNHPLELLQALIRQAGGTSTVNTLCKHLQEQTGVTWNKRFKQQYGPIKKFLGNHSEAFILDPNGSKVELKVSSSSIHDTASDERSKEFESTPLENEITMKEDEAVPQAHESSDPHPPHPPPPPVKGQCWFEFNDSRVSSITTDSIKKMFQGKESAYMLFYRQRSLPRLPEALGNASFNVPERLKTEIDVANRSLEAERASYEVAVNTVSVTLHLGPLYTQDGGAGLRNRMDESSKVINIDRRIPVDELRTRIATVVQEVGFSADQLCVFHTAKSLPAGLHLYDCIKTTEGISCMEAGLTYDMDVFVWDGAQVDGMPYSTGSDHEPIQLHLSYPGLDGTTVEVSRGFTKSCALSKLREYFSEFLSCPASDVTINQVKRSSKTGNASTSVLPSNKDTTSLSDIPLEDGDRLTAEIRNIPGKESRKFARSIADQQNRLMTFLVENRCGSTVAMTDTYPIHMVEVNKTEKLTQVKQHILSKLNLMELEGGGRLRVDDDVQGLGPPLCEDQDITKAGITQGCRLILERGMAPASNEICLNCRSEFNSMDDSCDIIIKRSATVQECCQEMVKQLGLIGPEWHLRKTNWCGEVGEVLDDEEATLDRLRVHSGDTFVVDSGKLPPKGFVRISIYNHSQLAAGEGLDPKDQSSQADEHIDIMKETTTPLHELDPTQFYPPPVGTLTKLGTVEIRREATLEHLKEVIITLPSISSGPIPSIKFLRVREFSNGRLGKVYRQLSQSLRQMKLYSGGDVSIQVLSFEEDLLPSQIVFYLQVRNSFERVYSPPFEVVYDTAGSTSPTGLRNFIAGLLGIPPEKTALAKHKFEKFQWIEIKDQVTESKKGSNKGKRGRGGGASVTRVNIKNSPILLRDGDIIGVKDLRCDGADTDNFTTIADDRGSAVLLAVQEEKRKKRKAKANNVDDTGATKRQRRPEIGIKIFVPDFSSHSN